MMFDQHVPHPLLHSQGLVLPEKDNSLLKEPAAIPTNLWGSSQSWLRLKENWARILSSHLTRTQPGEAVRLVGEYQDWREAGEEQRVSHHRWRTCSFRPRQTSDLNLTSIWTPACSHWIVSRRYHRWMSHLVVSVVDEVNTPVQQLLRAQHLPVLLQPGQGQDQSQHSHTLPTPNREP